MPETIFHTTFSTSHFWLLRAKNGSESGFRSAVSYRFGFNGKENDNEVKGTGNQQDYGMRIYDPRLGRFLSADPLIVQGQQYPELSPYQFASDSPIWGIDKDGLELEVAAGAIYLIGTAVISVVSYYIIKDAIEDTHIASIKRKYPDDGAWAEHQRKVDEAKSIALMHGINKAIQDNMQMPDDDGDKNNKPNTVVKPISITCLALKAIYEAEQYLNETKKDLQTKQSSNSSEIDKLYSKESITQQELNRRNTLIMENEEIKEKISVIDQSLYEIGLQKTEVKETPEWNPDADLQNDLQIIQDNTQIGRGTGF